MADEQTSILNAGSLNKIASNPDNASGNGKLLMVPGHMGFSSGKLHLTYIFNFSFHFHFNKFIFRNTNGVLDGMLEFIFH